MGKLKVFFVGLGTALAAIFGVVLWFLSQGRIKAQAKQFVLNQDAKDEYDEKSKKIVDDITKASKDEIMEKFHKVFGKKS